MFPGVENIGETAEIITHLGNTPGVDGVQFDHEVHNGHSCDGKGKPFCCLWLCEEVMTLVS